MCHLKALEKKGLITREPNMSRAIQLAAEPIEDRRLPLAGRIAAGVLHEAIEQNERVDFDAMFDPADKDLFVLEVNGDSMIEDQIADGDFVVIRKQKTARKGQIVVAITDEGEATLKRWFPERNRIRLEPANAAMKPIFVRDAASGRHRRGRGAEDGVRIHCETASVAQRLRFRKASYADFPSAAAWFSLL